MAIAIAIGAIGATPALAQQPPAPSAPSPSESDADRLRALEQRLDEVDQRARILERNLELAREREAEQARERVRVTAAPGKGVTLTLAGDRVSVNLRSRVQIRETIAHADDRTTSETNIKTLRLFLGGNVLTPDVKYFIQLALGGNDFEAGSSSPIFDAYVEYTRLRDLNLRAGQYFVPFDRARTIREFALQFADRQQPITELTLDRDVGVMAYSQDLGGKGGLLGYNVGVFGGEGRNRFGGTTPGYLYVARFTVRPFGAFDDDQEGDLQRLDRPRLAIGIGGAYNQSTIRARSTTGATYTLGGFDYVNAEADVVFKYAGLSVLGEVVLRQAVDGGDRRTGVDARGMPLTEWSRSGWGYIAQVGMMLTNHLEIAARWTQLLALGDTDPALIKQIKDQGHELGAAVNLYLNAHLFKIQADYHFLFGDDIGAGRHVARVQLDASF